VSNEVDLRAEGGRSALIIDDWSCRTPFLSFNESNFLS
jgi:hypothetical protein